MLHPMSYTESRKLQITRTYREGFCRKISTNCPHFRPIIQSLIFFASAALFTRCSSWWEVHKYSDRSAWSSRSQITTLPSNPVMSKHTIKKKRKKKKPFQQVIWTKKTEMELLFFYFFFPLTWSAEPLACRYPWLSKRNDATTVTRKTESFI